MSARVRQSVVSSICAVSGQQTASVPRARASRAHAPHYTLRTDRRAYDTRRGEWRLGVPRAAAGDHGILPRSGPAPTGIGLARAGVFKI